MAARCGDLVTADEPTAASKSLLDTTMVEGGQSDGCFPYPPCTDESDWSEVFREGNDLLDQFLASEAGPGRWGRGFTGYAK